MTVSSELNPRQEKLLAFYKARNVPLFGASEYTLLAPARDSILLTDENVTLAFILFGDTFDRKLRSIVIAVWLPALIFQLACSPIGFLTLTGMLPTKTVILTFPGAIFPFLILLRSHWIVINALSKKWEPLFLTFYSIIWCLSITFIVGKLDLRCIFVWLVIFPSLMASTFADASAVRLDFAFLKGDLSIAALTMPPYLISLAYVFTLVVVLNTRSHVEVEDQNKLLLLQSSGLSFDIEYSYIATSTGFTICLFIVKSIIMLFYNSSQCISLNAAMCIAVVKLKKIQITGKRNGKDDNNDLAKTKSGKSKKISSDKKSSKDDGKDGNDDILILEAGFLLKGGTGFVPITCSFTPLLPQSMFRQAITFVKSITNTTFKMTSRQILPQNSSQWEHLRDIILLQKHARKVFTVEDIIIVPQISSRKISKVISSNGKRTVTPLAPTNCVHHIILRQAVSKEKLSSKGINPYPRTVQDSDLVSMRRLSLVRDATETYIINQKNGESKYFKIQLALTRSLSDCQEFGQNPPIKNMRTIDNFNLNEINSNENILSFSGNVGDDCPNDCIDKNISTGGIRSFKGDFIVDYGIDKIIDQFEGILTIDSYDHVDKECVADKFLDNYVNFKSSGHIGEKFFDYKDNDIDIHANINSISDEMNNGIIKNDNEYNICSDSDTINSNHNSHINDHHENHTNELSTDMIVPGESHLSDRQQRLYPFYESVNTNNENANKDIHAMKNDNNSNNKNNELNNDTKEAEDDPLSDRQQRLLPFYKSVNTKIFGPHDYTVLSPMTSSILVSDECVTVASVLFGDVFDHNLRILARYIWYPAHIFQIGCLPIGVLSLLGHVSDWGALLTIPGFIFPMMMLLQCHWKIFQALLCSWEPIFITFYSTIFCISVTLMIHGYISVYVWVVIFPTLISSAFLDASAVRLDHSFLNETQRKFMLRNVILYASTTYIASLAYIFSIVVLLNLEGALDFYDDGNLDVQSKFATTTGASLVILMLKCLFKLIKEPTQCVSLRAPMTVCLYIYILHDNYIYICLYVYMNMYVRIRV